MWEPQHLKPYGPPCPVTGIALPLPFYGSKFILLSLLHLRVRYYACADALSSSRTDEPYNRPLEPGVSSLQGHKMYTQLVPVTQKSLILFAY
jgi:hypothetical protein